MSSCAICGQEICICDQLPDTVKNHVQKLNEMVLRLQTKRAKKGGKFGITLSAEDLNEDQQACKVILQAARKTAFTLNELVENLNKEGVVLNLPLSGKSMSFQFRDQKMPCSLFGKSWNGIKNDIEKKAQLREVRKAKGEIVSPVRNSHQRAITGQSATIRDILLKEAETSSSVDLNALSEKTGIKVTSLSFGLSNLITEKAIPLSKVEVKSDQEWLNQHAYILNDWNDGKLRTLMERCSSQNKPDSLDYVQLRVWLENKEQPQPLDDPDEIRF